MIGDPPIPLPPAFPATGKGLALSDVMILVAAFAFGLAWLRAETRREIAAWTSHTPYSTSASPASSRILMASGVFEATVPLAGSITLGLALVQLRRPGLFSASVFGRPGLLACLSASVAIVLYLAKRTVEAVMGRWLVPLIYPTSLSLPDVIESPGRLSDLAHTAGVAVAATWLVSRLGPARGVGCGAIERAGRVVGLYWMAMIAARALLEILWGFCVAA